MTCRTKMSNVKHRRCSDVTCLFLYVSWACHSCRFLCNDYNRCKEWKQHLSMVSLHLVKCQRSSLSSLWKIILTCTNAQPMWSTNLFLAQMLCGYWALNILENWWHMTASRQFPYCRKKIVSILLQSVWCPPKPLMIPFSISIHLWLVVMFHLP